MEIFLKETFWRVFIYYPDLKLHLAVLENKEKPCSIASGLFSPHKKKMRLLGLFTWPWKKELTLKNTHVIVSDPLREQAQRAMFYNFLGAGHEQSMISRWLESVHNNLV